MELLRLISAVKQDQKTDLSCAIRDVLTDLAHICEDNNIDFDGRCDAAIEVAKEEEIP
jgi:hypothetical protein